MKKYIYLIISAINAGLVALYITFLVPNTIVPMHFNLNGEVDRYGSKWELMILAGIPFALCLIYAIYNLIAEYMNLKSKNKKYTQKIFTGIFVFLLVLFWTLMIMTTTATALDKNLVFGIITIFISLLFMFIGNIMPKLKQNSVTGIRIKATLNSEYVWKKANRLGGFLAVIAGAVGVVAGLVGIALGEYATVLLFAEIGVFLLTQIVVVIYANKLYKTVK